MYQTVGYQALEYYAKAIDLPIFRRPITRKPVNTDCNYSESPEDEVEDMYEALKSLRDDENISYDAISVGAVLSNYQKNRAENVCARLNIQMLAYLWEADQESLLRDMIKDGMNAILIKVAVIGLNASHLGKNLVEILPKLLELRQKYGINVAGEGGEYETLTLDCPMFKKRLVLKRSEIITHSDDAFAPVAYLRPLEIHLEEKQHST